MGVNENEIIVLLVILGAVGGAWGARSGKADAWRGAVAVTAAIVIPAAIFVALDVKNIALSFASEIVVLAIVGSMLKLSPRQIIMSGVAAVLLVTVAGLFGLFNL